MTEKTLQDIVARWALGRSHELVVPNVNIYPWESDLISVTKAGLIYEYEMKITRADFRRDAQKFRHARLFIKPVAESFRPGVGIGMDFGTPNYFYYVTPAGLIGPEDLPEKAGLIEIADNMLTVRVSARRRHKETINERQRTGLARSLMYRYWKQRGLWSSVPIEKQKVTL